MTELLKKYEKTAFWLLLVLFSVISYGGFMYWFQATAPQANPELILNLPK